MNKLELSGYWNIFNGRLKQKWARLMDDDSHSVAGRQEERLGRMQKRAGKRREAIEKTVEEALCSYLYEHAPAKTLPYGYDDPPNMIASCLISDNWARRKVVE